MINLAPVVLFVYNRPEHTSRTLKFLELNRLAHESRLIIFSDGPKMDSDIPKVTKVRKLINNINGFKSIEIIERPRNLGLANSVITGINEIFNTDEKVIVMEDDLECTPDFLDFMNESLNRYELDKDVFSVSAYSYPLTSLKDYPYSVYFSYRGSSWSWATWKDRWQSIDWDIKDSDRFIKDKKLQHAFNKGGDDLSAMLIKQINGLIDSWAIRFAYNAHKQNEIHLLASRSKVNNIGQDNSGTHSRRTSKYNVELLTEKYYIFPDNVALDDRFEKEIRHFFRRNVLKRIISNIRSYLKSASN